MNYTFTKAKPVYSKTYINEMNVSLMYVLDFKKDDDLLLRITGNSVYQIFLNGTLISYGPARAAHKKYRVDNIKIKDLLDNNRLVIIIAGYNCNSFDHVNTSPFICAEILNKSKEALYYTGKDFDTYLYEPRYQKVSRLSYQRCFSESYNNKFTNNIFLYGTYINFKKVDSDEVKSGKYLSRKIKFPKLKFTFAKIAEYGNVNIDNSLKNYEDRYMNTKYLKIFKKSSWEVSPNDIISKLTYKKYSKKIPLKDLTFKTFSFDQSYTGFIRLKLDVKIDSSIYIVFDEINTNVNSDETIGINFSRNTTQNIISYELKPGSYNLISFEPYTAKYIRVIVLNGEIDAIKCGIIKLENYSAFNLKFQSNDKRINNIIKAGLNTFAQNSVDILTDCPSRERAGWLCDSFFSGRAELLITGKNDVERNFLENYSHYKYNGDIPRGMLPMCYPADFKDQTYIPNWSMFYVLELYNYLKKNNNSILFNSSKSKIINLINFFKRFENEYGLLENLESWVFVEWSHANDKESIEGVNFPSNMLYSEMLIKAGYLLKDNVLVEKGENLKKQIINMSYNGTFFVDNAIRDSNNILKRTNRISETTQYYAFYFDVANKDNHKELFDCLIYKFGPKRDDNLIFPEVFKSNVFIGDYLRLEILLRERLENLVLEETVDYFSKMADLTMTLWEHDSSFASLNHGFASFIVNIIIKALTGIENIDYINKIVYYHKVNCKIDYDIDLKIKNLHFKVTNNKETINFIFSSKIKLLEL